MDRHVGRLARGNVELPEQIVEAKPRNHPAKADAKRAFLVVDAHRDHRLFKTRIADTGHCEKKLAAEKRWRIHALSIGASGEGGQSPRPYQAPIGLAKGTAEPSDCDPHNSLCC